MTTKNCDKYGFKTLVKIKAAAERYYWFRWQQAIERTKKNGGGFEVRDF